MTKRDFLEELVEQCIEDWFNEWVDDRSDYEDEAEYLRNTFRAIYAQGALSREAVTLKKPELKPLTPEESENPGVTHWDDGKQQGFACGMSVELWSRRYDAFKDGWTHEKNSVTCPKCLAV